MGHRKFILGPLLSKEEIEVSPGGQPFFSSFWPCLPSRGGPQSPQARLARLRVFVRFRFCPEPWVPTRLRLRAGAGGRAQGRDRERRRLFRGRDRVDNWSRGALGAGKKCGTRRSGDAVPGVSPPPRPRPPPGLKAREPRAEPAARPADERARSSRCAAAARAGEEEHPVSSPAPTADHVPGLSREL